MDVVQEWKRTWLISTLGFVLFVCGILLLTWNEGRAVHHAHSLDEAFSNVIPLSIYEPLRPELDGRLVHISGHLLIDEPLTEPDYGVSIQAVKLKRRVQMYQWIEERTLSNYADTDAAYSENARNRDDSDYYYVTEWRDKLVDSNGFYIRHGHHNPTEMPLRTQIFVSPSVRVGQLNLGMEIKEKFSDFVEMTSDERPERRDIKLHLGIYYHSYDVWNPEVGDIRVQFYYAGHNNDPVSVVAMQKDGALIPYFTTRGHSVALLRHGVLNVNQMFEFEHLDVRFDTWKLRAAGLFVLYASCVFLGNMFKVLSGKLPRTCLPLADYLSSSFVLALSVGLFVIAIAWVFHRPLLGFGLFSASLSPIFYGVLSIYNR